MFKIKIIYYLRKNQLISSLRSLRLRAFALTFFFQPLQDCGWTFDQAIGAPGLWLFMFANITEQRHQCLHARPTSGHDIAFCIPHIQAFTGLAVALLTGMQQRLGIWFALWQCIATDDAGSALVESQCLE